MSSFQFHASRFKAPPGNVLRNHQGDFLIQRIRLQLEVRIDHYSFVAAATCGKGLPPPWMVYGIVTQPLVWPSDMPTGPHGTPRPTGPQAGRVTTQNTTDEHGRRRFVLCSEHTQKTRAAELLREAQGGLRSG